MAIELGAAGSGMSETSADFGTGGAALEGRTFVTGGWEPAKAGTPNPEEPASFVVRSTAGWMVPPEAVGGTPLLAGIGGLTLGAASSARLVCSTLFVVAAASSLSSPTS